MLESFAGYEVYNLLNDAATIAIIPGRIQAENYSKMHGVQTENTNDIGGGLNVGYIDNYDWMQYDVNAKQGGTFQLAFRVASLSQSGQITLTSSLSGALARVNLPITGGWQNWQTVFTEVQLQEGQQALNLIAATGGFNINWLEFTLLTDVPEPMDQSFSFQLHQNYPNPFNHATIYQL